MAVPARWRAAAPEQRADPVPVVGILGTRRSVWIATPAVEVAVLPATVQGAMEKEPIRVKCVRAMVTLPEHVADVMGMV